MEEAKTIFFDFDGVIKESVKAKSEVFEQLFLPFGEQIAWRATNHHEANGGMSRFDKIPIYLEWTGEVPSQLLIDEYSRKFSVLVKQKVIESKWVSGVLAYLEKNAKNKTYFLVTATPQEEIEEIVIALQINHYFRKVIGAPTRKVDAIRMLLNEYSIKLDQAIMIGDSMIDYEAALANRLNFVLRRTNLNKELQGKLECSMIIDFSDEQA